MLTLRLDRTDFAEALYLAHVSAALVVRDDPGVMPSYFRRWDELSEEQRELWQRTADRLTALYT